MSRADDELVWALTAGVKLKAIQDVVMEGTGEVAFLVDKEYVISSMHPLAHPPFVRVQDEQGQSHILEPDDLRSFFTWAWKPAPSAA